MTSARPSLLVLHGSNMNMLGVRLPEIYGPETLANLEGRIRRHATRYGFDIDFRQSNSEGDLVTWIQQARTGSAAAVIINPAAFTHTSVAILDALRILEVPIMEVHYGNPYRYDAFRKFSYVSLVSTAVIAGFRQDGYIVAIDAIAEHSGKERLIEDEAA